MAADDLRDCRVLFKGLKLNISLIYSGVKDFEHKFGSFKIYSFINVKNF